MIYRVVLDGNDILDYSDINLSLISPVLEIEINNAGSLEFVMPPYHKYYDMIRILTSTVEVYEDDILIWFGRPISEKIDFFKQKKVYCEGALSFFNDSVMRPLEIDGSSLHSFFRTLIDSHNGQVASDRTFIVGNITIDDGTVYRKLNYESTYDAIQNMCLSTNDGYLFIRKENGINYIDWLKDMPYECNQQIEFGINLLNYSSNFDASDFVTCVLPIGKTDSETDQPLTIASINSGSDIIVSEAAQTYGKVTKPLSLSDISDPYELMTEGRKYLENSQFNALIIECSAADLHSMNKTLDLFRVGQNVHCISNPHLIDRDFPLSKIQINLDSAAKIITLGIIKRRTLTRIYKQESENAYQQDSYTPESYDPAAIEDLNGDGWEVIMPDEDGGPVTAVRMPIKITIAKPPNKTDYTPGETLDFTGISVNIWTKNKDGQEVIWTNPPKYLDGKAPMSELSFSTKTAPNISEFSVMVTWKYKGKSYNTTLALNSDGLDTSPLIKPIPHASSGSMSRISGSGHRTFFDTGTGQLAYYVDGTQLGKWNCIAASATSGAVVRRIVYDRQGQQSNSYTHNITKTFTYNGKTVYYSNITTGQYSQQDYQIASISPACNNGSPILTDVPDSSVAHAAWLMIYG